MAVAAPNPALDRLRETAPDGPPFLGLLLDEATVRCLAAGVVNARAEVAAQQAVTRFEGSDPKTGHRARGLPDGR